MKSPLTESYLVITQLFLVHISFSLNTQLFSLQIAKQQFNINKGQNLFLLDESFIYINHRLFL